jgi:hypothetical protein
MDVAFNAIKIRYSVLDDILGKVLKRNNIKTANLFFNMDYMNYRFRNVSNNTKFQACGASAFKQYASNVLNLVAHYKKWFNRNNVRVRCFIYYTNAEGGFTSALINRNYRSKFVETINLNNPDCYYVNQTVNGGMQLLTSVCDYIEGVYLINSKGEEPSVVPYLISQTMPADWNYILTQDRLELQYTNYDRFSILYPSRTLGSMVVNASDLWNIIGEKEHKITPHLSEFDPRLFVPVMAIAGDAVRSIRKIRSIGWITILDSLDEIWSTNKDHSIVTILDEITKLLASKSKATEEKYIYTYKMNILMISMKSRYDVMSETNKTMILSQIKDVPDRETINAISINPMIFGNYPINVEALFNASSSYVDWNKK